MRSHRFGRRRSAFTLIELLLVLVILGVLAGVVVPNLLKHADKSKITGAQSSIAVLSGVLNTFALDNDRLPTTDEGLNALLVAPSDMKGWNGPYIDPNKLKDPWDQPYHYVQPGSHNPGKFDLYSSGPDKQDGTADDIGNWVSQ